MKRPFYFLLLVISAVILCGCHGAKDTKEFSLPEEFDSNSEYEITFWAKNDTNKTQTAIYQQAIADFENLYPNIHINLRLYTDYGKIYNDVITNIATGTTPNICITYPDHIATYLSGENIILPLELLAENEKYGLGGRELRFDGPAREEIIPEFLNECFINGELYALPFMRSTEACYVNKTYVEKLGYTLPEVLTWDFVWEVSEAAMKKDAEGNFLVNNQKVLIPFIYKSTDNMMIQMLRQLDAGYSTADGEIRIFNDNTKDILYTIARHVKTGAFSTFKISSYPANFLNAGQCIFAVDSTAGATWMGTDAPLLDISKDRLVKFETAVLPIPQYDSENLSMISQGPSVCVFNKQNSQEVLASWLFTQYLLSDDVQIAYAETEGYVPVTSKAQKSEEYMEYLSKSGSDNNVHYRVKIEASQLMMNNVENTFVTPVFVGSTSLRDAAGQMIENVTKSVKRRETIDETYMEQLFDDVTALYRLDQIARNGNSTGPRDLGPLPNTSVALLITLGAVWILMGIYIITDYLISGRKRV